MKKTKLQIMREKKGLTVEQLARISIKNYGLSMVHPVFNMVINAIINVEDRAPGWKLESGKMANAIAETLGCSLDELVEE
ncbi:helix-turn-helix transcriptional regulator [Lactococcus petauri]|nr:helix-turn-helix transcriptional regulator [Lactococcus petauri]